MKTDTKISAIIPVTERYDDVRSVYKEYKNALMDTRQDFDITYVLDGEFPDVLEELTALQADGEKIKVIQFAKWFGEATALSAGFENTDGETILTLPAYRQFKSEEIVSMLNELQENDMVIGRRWPRTDSFLNRMQTNVFHSLFNFITGSGFKDLGCGLRVFKRRVVDEVNVYGDQHRFLPVLARQKGFRVIQIDVAQSTEERPVRIYAAGVYIRRLLDILTIFFLAKFTKKPLRFFGLVGSTMFAIGGILLCYLVVDRIFWDVALADRPALLLSSLMVVLGIQLFALGLIGELIIFTHAKDMKEYTVEKIIN
jgi:glycosyltransferase involved in cell wall biosynthesis